MEIVSTKMTKKESQEKLQELFGMWREDIVQFVRDVMGVEPTNQQKIVLDSFARPGSKTAVKAGHGVGKSASMAWCSIWAVALFTPCKVGATAPAKHQLEGVLMPEIAMWVRNSIPMIRDMLEATSFGLYRKGYKDVQFLTAKTADPKDPSALQGLHSENMFFLIDEAFGVANSIYEVIGGTLSTPESRVLLCGNPTATSGFAFDCFHKMQKTWNCISLSCLDSPLVSKEYEAEQAERWGKDSDQYRIRVLGEFPHASENQFIPALWCDHAQERSLSISEYSWAPVVFGVDVARAGKDRTVIVRRQGLQCDILFMEYRTLDLMQLCDRVVYYANEQMRLGDPVQAVFVDDVGVGGGVTDRLRQMLDTVYAVNFGKRAGDVHYYNKRSECWGKMKEWLNNGASIPKNGALGGANLYTDLIGPEFEITPEGKIKLERKVNMKSRGLDSPDLADALALTFSYNIVNLDLVQPKKSVKKKASKSLLGRYSSLNRRK